MTTRRNRRSSIRRPRDHRTRVEPLPITSRRKNPGDSSGEATPVPIPNTEVKLSSAEDTERAAFRENRSSPGFLRFRRVIAHASATRPPSAARVSSPSGRRRILAAMTVTGRPRDRSVGRRPLPPGRAVDRDAAAVHEVCPYLAVEPTAPGAARTPAREHRCAAVDAAGAARRREAAPAVPAPPTTERARPSSAARGRRAPRRAAPGPATMRASLWSAPRRTPVVLEPGGASSAPSRSASARSGGQAVLIGADGRSPSSSS